MKPPPFEYVAARSLDEALAALDDEDAKPIAGGQSLVPALNMRLVRPSRLVDLRHAGLDTVTRENGSVRIGATVRQRDLAALADDLPLVARALPFVGHAATRNRGTVGGSIAHADGAAELPLCLVALGGTVVAEGRDGRREIPADEFFVTHFATALRPGELVVETVWPAAQPGDGFGFAELALRAGDFALAMAAVVRRGEEVRVAVGAVTDRPTLVDDLDGIDPPGSMHASPAYLRHVTQVLVDRAREQAWT